MKLLDNPELRYGPLPRPEAAQALLEPRPDLQTSKGALEYLELHLGRVRECLVPLAGRDRGLWSFILRNKAKAAFTNTTRALRMIMVFHRESSYVLSEMARRIREEQQEEKALEPHYEYLLRLLHELGKPKE